MTRTILVIGAADGIGHAVAERLLRRGGRVIACAARSRAMTDKQLLGARPIPELSGHRVPGNEALYLAEPFEHPAVRRHTATARPQ